jgi:hypothetical protein
MPCGSYEDRLLDYDELSAGERELIDAHVAACIGCREYLEVLTGIDAQLTQVYGGARIGTEIRLHKPSFIPEVLDFLGWASVIAFVVCAALLFVPVWAFSEAAATMVTPTLIVATVIAVSAAAWIGLRSRAELGR